MSGLPPGWAEHIDPNTGNPYYHNTATGEVTWTKPGDDGAAAQAQPTPGLDGGGMQNGADPGGMGGMAGGMGMGQMGMGQPQMGQPMGQGMGGMGQMGMGQPMGQMQMGMGQPMGQMQQPMGGCMGGQMGMGMGGGCMGMDGMGGQMGMGGMGMGGGMGGMGMGMGGGMDGGLQTGTVKSWNDEKGFGFIIPNGGGDDIFVHRSALTDGGMLLQGAQVQFEVTWNAQKGKSQASRVTGAVPQQKAVGGFRKHC
ncbi:cspA [Symbiodinium natans]|uniref:CspA protein n=1 Tax=Symbiodinium natans TaxID=878477 RepID=A0A812P9T1_9DINO|nr:cspA [Symbiodinium natans]